jgi:hypothetical protein
MDSITVNNIQTHWALTVQNNWNSLLISFE